MAKDSVGVLCIRKDIKYSSLFIAENREKSFRHLSIDQLIPMATLATLTALKVYPPDTLAQAAVDRYQLEDRDLFTDWLRFCRVLERPQREVAALGKVELLSFCFQC